MQGFCLQLDESKLQAALLNAIRGRGAFGRFKRLVYAEGIEQDWYKYRDQALKELVAEFLEAEGIPFVGE